MPYLLDTNIFLRLASADDPARLVALRALQELRTRKETLCYTPQILAELWSVATRSPAARGGLGPSPAETEQRARMIERYFRLLPDSLATYQEWRQLIVRHAVVGAQAHDARLIASMNAYGISQLLTLRIGNSNAILPQSHRERTPGVAWREPSGCAWDLPADAQARTQHGSQRRPWPRGAPYLLDTSDIDWLEPSCLGQPSQHWHSRSAGRTARQGSDCNALLPDLPAC
jgi:predicted nucleic acid-binding protein